MNEIIKHLEAQIEDLKADKAYYKQESKTYMDKAFHWRDRFYKLQEDQIFSKGELDTTAATKFQFIFVPAP